MNNIDCPSNFSFSQCYEYLKRQDKECLFSCEKNRVYRAIALGEKIVCFYVYENNDVCIKCLNYDLSETEEKELESFVKEWFGMEHKIESFYSIARNDSILAPLIEKYSGLRVMGLPNLFECLSWAIIGQQINLSFAHSVKRQFIEAFGQILKFEGREYYIFPRAKDVLQLSIEALKEVQLSKQKAMYLLNLAEAIEGTEIEKEKLSKMTVTDIEKSLIAIKGIGKWSAHYAMMKTFGIFSAFPIQDVGLHNAIRHILKMDRKPNYEELGLLSKNWGDWKAYATFYLWRVLY